MKIILTFKPYEFKPLQAHDFAEEYIVEVRRKDGLGLTEVEARTALSMLTIDRIVEKRAEKARAAATT